MVFAGVFLCAIAFPALVIWRGYALTVLWGWFVVPTFNLPPISIAAALGISLIVSMLTNRPDLQTKENDGWTSVMEHLAYGIALPALSLFLGWIFQMFM